MHIYLEVYGRVPKDFSEFVYKVIKDTYERLARAPILLEVYIYEYTDIKLKMLLEEAVKIGVVVTGDYPISHEAWMGWPRIHVDYEKCKVLESSELESLLVHEAVHSILHGSTLSYVISIDRDLSESLENNLPEIVYLASVVVKDLEVHNYLVKSSMQKYIEKYREYVLKEIKNIQCHDLINILEFAKIITPCIFVDCNINRDLSINTKCSSIVNNALEALNEIVNLKQDLSFKVNKLIKSFIKLTSRVA